MKILTVHFGESFEKYPIDQPFGNHPSLLEEFTYEIDSQNGVLRIKKQTRESQYEEVEHVVFGNWDYYTIEEIEEDE